MIKSFLRLLSVPKGFNPDGVLTLELSPGHLKYPWGSPRRKTYYQELLARVQTLPGIHSASLTSFLPLAGMTPGMGLQQLDGRPPFEPGTQPMIRRLLTLAVPYRSFRKWERAVPQTDKTTFTQFPFKERSSRISAA
ncbi:MAG TPA: hypothetical protein VJ810_35115 [Blastocatellia bacterium]|nr:hypothetical protein [Blastocatellia bacterium]